MKRATLEWLGWFAFAAALLAPAWGRGDLVGHPDVDVWNHAWGLWWWAETLGRGELPWHTALLSHPGGGTLWFADPLGALAALPVTLLAGPAVAWNLLLVTRVAWAGFHARRFAGLLGVPGPHTVVAGVAFATSPYLLAELHNGISEVCATGWVPLVLAEWLRAAREGGARAWSRAGLVLGMTAWATPYYALALVILLLPATLFRLRGAVPAWRAALPGLLVAGLLGGGAVATWRAALSAPDAVIQRDETSESSLMRHNAVDLREPFLPGAFRSVDYAAEYGGEQFRHSVALGLVVLGLAAVAVVRRPRALLPWLALLLAAVVLGLGSRPFFAGRYVAGESVHLPFGWLVSRIPGLAITHPARLAVVAHAVAAALAADALRDRGRAAWALLPLLLVERLLFSATPWPVSGSPSTVPPIYTEIAASSDPRGVLDLPAQVRRTMATSAYFWYQTVHGRPLPWWPNVRTDDNGDRVAVRAFIPPRASAGMRPRFDALSPEALAHLCRHYGWVIVHPAFDRLTQAAGESTRVLAEAWGAPEEVDGLRVWRVPPPSGDVAE
jgi:hypothetical protein